MSDVLKEVQSLQEEISENQLVTYSGTEGTVGFDSNENASRPNPACQPVTTSGQLYHSAKVIQASVKEVASEIRNEQRESMELCSMEISYAAAMKYVPKELYNHLGWLIYDASPKLNEDGRIELQKQQHEKVLNLAQDICFAATKMPTPKHVGTALHLVKQMQNKETITLLNRFGHCTSYTDAQRYISTMASSVEAEIERIRIFIPKNMKHGLFTQCAIDNLDFHENTADGTTTHGTTHVFYQYGNYGPGQLASVPIYKARKTSICTRSLPEPEKSYLSLADRKRGRSLAGIQLLAGQSQSFQ